MTKLQAITCCQAIPPLASPEVADTLLENMLITEYYDGASAGFVQCPVCASVYHFITLDWSQNRFVRVVALSLVPADSMARLQSFFAEAPPRSRWIPKLLQRASEQDLDRVEAFLSEILARAESPSIVLAWNVATGQVHSARNVSGLSSDQVISLFDLDRPVTQRQYDWFRELGHIR
jgi:hypothetical protein